MSKLSPMKNTKTNNLSKKGQHTFLKHFKRDEQQSEIGYKDRKTLRKTKQVNRWEAWA